MGLRMKYFNIMGGSLKNPIFRVGGGGGVPEKPIYRGELPKKEGWPLSRFKGTLVVFFGVGGGDTLMHTMRAI